MPDVRKLRKALKPSNTDRGDAISALVLAIHLITQHCKKLKYIKNIVLVTNGTPDVYDSDGLDNIASQLLQQNINLAVLGIDFDDPDGGAPDEHEGRDPAKDANQAALHQLCQAAGDDLAVLGTLQQAVAEMSRPRLKPVRPVPSYRGTLTLGDVSADGGDGSDGDDRKPPSPSLSIDVERYPRTAIAKPVSASRFAVQQQQQGKAEAGGGDGDAAAGAAAPRQLEPCRARPDQLQTVTQARAYQVDRPDEAGQKMDIDGDTMEKGYKYGRTVVPISATDEAVTVYPTEPSMQIVGFIAAPKVANPYGAWPCAVLRCPGHWVVSGLMDCAVPAALPHVNDQRDRGAEGQPAGGRGAVVADPRAVRAGLVCGRAVRAAQGRRAGHDGAGGRDLARL